jgi:hypothetical protein
MIFWISTQVIIIHQSLTRKLNYKSITNLPGKKRKPSPQAQPTPDGPPARSARAPATQPCETAHGARPTRGCGPGGENRRRAGNLLKSPQTHMQLHELYLHNSSSLQLSTKDPSITRLHNGEVPDAPAHAGATARARDRLPEQPGAPLTPLGGRHSPTGRRVASRTVGRARMQQDGSSTMTDNYKGWRRHSGELRPQQKGRDGLRASAAYHEHR